MTGKKSPSLTGKNKNWQGKKGLTGKNGIDREKWENQIDSETRAHQKDSGWVGFIWQFTAGDWTCTT